MEERRHGEAREQARAAYHLELTNAHRAYSDAIFKLKSALAKDSKAPEKFKAAMRDEKFEGETYSREDPLIEEWSTCRSLARDYWRLVFTYATTFGFSPEEAYTFQRRHERYQEVKPFDDGLYENDKELNWLHEWLPYEKGAIVP